MRSATQTLHKASSKLMSELRDLFHEHRFLAHSGPETVSGALRALGGIEEDVLAVEAAMEALRIEDEALS